MKIVTDSAADMRPEEIKELGITVAPLLIKFPDQEIESDQITPDQFYSRLREMEPQIPTTSQPSSGVFSRIYQSLAKMGEGILSIHISSGLSGTIQSARLAAQEERSIEVTLVDSMTLSGGQRFQVLAAALADKAGVSKDAILEQLTNIREATEVVYSLDTMSYLARGGRIGRVQALAGALLNIKPVISVDKKDGKYSTIGKERTIRRAMESIVDYQKQIFGGRTPVWVSVMHGQFLEQAEGLAEMIRKSLNVTKLEILRISPVLGVHTGPGIVGAAVVPSELFG